MSPAGFESFGFEPGEVLSAKYEIVQPLGSGWEGEAYLVRELSTGIERAVKLFFPHRNLRGRASRRYATKLHRLRRCPIVIQYHAQESVRFRGVPVTYLVSEYVPGEPLAQFLTRRPRGRLSPLAAVHLLYALARGLEPIHDAGEYHGDLHTDNVIVAGFGLTFELRLLDFFHREGSRASLMRGDVLDAVRIFYDCLGGARHYARQPPEVKAICRGLKHGLIAQRFPSMKHLRAYLEALRWS